jgi:ubiquinone/menaquinone biosynthesis C-methylase UbiE
VVWAWILGALGLVITALFVYWQVVIAEGAYLGQKVVTLLYDRVAHQYDDIKDYQALDEHYFLGIPLALALGDAFNGIILDVATGTGRVPIAMTNLAHFQGKFVGLDHSAKMLAIAQAKMPDLPLVQADAMQLPFARDSVQAVTCLEALEFLPAPKLGVAEMVRVLEPGGVLFTTNRVGWEAKLMPGKALRQSQLISTLKSAPLVNISIRPWESILSFDPGGKEGLVVEDDLIAEAKLPFVKRLVVEFTTSRYQKIWARKDGSPP